MSKDPLPPNMKTCELPGCETTFSKVAEGTVREKRFCCPAHRYQYHSINSGEALGRIARRKGISVSEVVRRALEEYLEREEARS